MRLTAYTWSDIHPRLVPAPATRDWMDDFTGHHAYKCLPLAISNSYGWQVLCPHDLTVAWNGGMAQQDVTVQTEGHWVESNFARGVVTFLTGFIFRTDPGIHLMATGPTNWAKDGIAPMTGVMETDWLPYPFTMNWRFLRPGTITWKKDEPFCQIFLIQGHLQEMVDPEIKSITTDPELQQEHDKWAAKRTDLRRRMAAGDLDALRHPWDRDYFIGRMANGDKCPFPHASKLRVKDPVTKE